MMSGAAHLAASCRFNTVADLGSPQAAADSILDRYLTKEFMSTRIGIKREGEVVSATARTEEDGRQVRRAAPRMAMCACACAWTHLHGRMCMCMDAAAPWRIGLHAACNSVCQHRALAVAVAVAVASAWAACVCVFVCGRGGGGKGRLPVFQCVGVPPSMAPCPARDGTSVTSCHTRMHPLTRCAAPRPPDALPCPCVAATQYYDIAIRMRSYASRNPYTSSALEVQAAYGLEWDRTLITVLGVANK